MLVSREIFLQKVVQNFSSFALLILWGTLRVQECYPREVGNLKTSLPRLTLALIPLPAQGRSRGARSSGAGSG